MDIARFDDNMILDLMTDGVLALDREFIIRRINPAACRLLGIRDSSKLSGAPVSRVMDDTAFLRLRSGEKTQVSDVVVPHGKAVPLECSFCCDEGRTLFVCIMRGMPAHQQCEENGEALSRHLRAAELADTMCEKQLQIVQEIAGLLGETAVETQAAVQELKRTLLPDRVGNND